MRLDELVGFLQTFEMSLQSQSKSKVKGVAFKVKEDFDKSKDSDEEIGLLTRRFNKMLRKQKHINKPFGRPFNKNFEVQHKVNTYYFYSR
jgi:hypothetical protein